MPEPSDMAAWFSEEELGDCPSCGERKLIPPRDPEQSLTVCLECGALDPLRPWTGEGVDRATG